MRGINCAFMAYRQRAIVREGSAMKKAKIAAVAAASVTWAAVAVAADDPKLDQHRPQEEAIAAAPLPYRQEQVTFDNPAASGIRLAGTLSIPPGAGPFPAIVVIPGTGKHDRDAAIADHKIPLVIGDTLTRRGYAVLRYDKRGVAQSTGDYENATTHDLTSDAAAAVAYLRSRSDVDGNKIGIVGHSQGATLGALVAARDSHIAFVVMLAGFALPGKVLVAEQIRRMAIVDGQSPEAANRTFNLNRRVYDAIAGSKDEADAEARVHKVLAATQPKPTEADSNLAIEFAKIGYMRDILAYDPRPELGKVRVPVLFLCGSKDLLLPPDVNLPAVRQVLSHDKDVTVVELPGLNHMFQHSATGSPQEWGTIDETLAPEVLSMISEWVGRHAR
jgi:pimeloyl-ACP methyl ester carboxylesterase